jgi:hypothetical protein
VIRFVLDTRYICLKLNPTWMIKIRTQWMILTVIAGDAKNRIVVTRFIIYLLRIPIFLSSKSQKGAKLLRSEVEYVAMSKTVKEIRFIFYLLRHMRISVKLPIMVHSQ